MVELHAIHSFQRSRPFPKTECSKRFQRPTGDFTFRIYLSKGFDPNPKPKKTSKKEKETPLESETVEQPEKREIPSYVANRMLSRILVFSIVPVFIGLCTLPVFYYLKVTKDIDIPTWIVYLVQFFTFGSGVFGITYAIFSTNVGQQEDYIGLDTFKSNIKDLIQK